MKKLKPLSRLKKDLWKLFSTYIKKRDKGVCFTCGAKGLSGSSYHGGHFIKASVGGLILYFNEDNVHGQCARCNLWLDGDQYHYGIRLGPKKVKELEAIKLKTKGVVWDRKDYETKIAYYKAKLKK